MAETFDPYHKWLGISPQNQPPDLYRLLSLERFETDVEVIEAAANRQMAYIHGCSSGAYVEHSQRLLNEIAAARLCLLDPKQKAAYDAGLRHQSAPIAVPAPPPLEAAGPASGESLTGTIRDFGTTQLIPPATGFRPFSPLDTRPAGASPMPDAMPPRQGFKLIEVTPGTAPRGHKRRRSQPLMLLIVVGAFGAVAAVVIGIALTGRLNSGGATVVTVVPPPAADLKSGDGRQKPPALPPKSEKSKDESRLESSRQDLPHAGGEPHLPDSKALKTGQVAGVPPAAGFDAWMHEAEEALGRGDVSAAQTALLKILDGPIPEGPAAPNRERAAQMWVELKMVSSDPWALQMLAQLDDQKFADYSRGVAGFEFPSMTPSVVSIARATLQRNLPEAKRRREAKAKPPEAIPPAGIPKPVEPPVAGQPDAVVPAKPPQPPNPPSATPTDPREFLESLGLKRVFSMWVDADEARCLELIDQIRALEKQQHDADLELRKSSNHLLSAKRAVERAEEAKKKADEDDDPPKDSPARLKIDARASTAADEAATAEEEVTTSKKQAEEAKEQVSTTWAEVRRLSAGVDEHYARLAKDSRVGEALRQMGQQIGHSDEFKKARNQFGRTPHD